MGITSKCKDAKPSERIKLSSGDEKYDRLIVDVGNCNGVDENKLGLHQLEVVDQVWMKAQGKQYNYFAFADLDETNPLKKVWDHEDKTCDVVEESKRRV